ncbi:DUF4258 domain-containing protein [Epilithonimonas hungarica]|uniref:DUF4258 domain-containing protein n=1 Tax=Epilithonimonas hungarica TaxID=454006 RepID=A0A1G7IZA8_9FLAO|nr:DUF4258 domain-containing protein [Epilithonimonas hungarica]MPT32232.1 DUF4258 domain-containing protein [Chryseobacterium sp.]SDF17884.1 hypothetical protein SAMN05421825_1231 [Epilithonimonas hungarica]
MLKKLKFYFIGLVPGLLIVFFVLNQKGASCSYFPNDRVIAETLTKDFSYSENFKKEMEANKISEKQLKDEIITNGAIDFDKSQAQKQPCPEYVLLYPKNDSRFEINYSKCKEKAEFTGFKKLK